MCIIFVVLSVAPAVAAGVCSWIRDVVKMKLCRGMSEGAAASVFMNLCLCLSVDLFFMAEQDFGRRSGCGGWADGGKVIREQRERERETEPGGDQFRFRNIYCGLGERTSRKTVASFLLSSLYSLLQ